MTPDVQKVANAWSGLSSNYAASASHKFGPSLSKLIRLARPTKDDVCLDVGTGTGHTAAQLAQRVKKVYGLDPAEGMRQAAADMYGHLENLEFIGGTSEDTRFPDATFDIVTARHTLHHHPNIKRTLAEIRRVLKPGGRLVIVDEISPHEDLDTWYHTLEVTRDPTHERAYTMHEWRGYIKDAGLDWIVGDADTSYRLEVEAWIKRMNPSEAQAENVRYLFREASSLARKAFNIVYDGEDASSFDMPMALILAVKPEGETYE